MSAFKELRDISNNFEYDLQKVSTELFSAKIRHSFMDTVEQKLKDLALFSSKQKLLKAIPQSYTQQVLKRASTESVSYEYGESASWKVLEQTTAESLSLNHAVKGLLTTPDIDLDGQMLERKQDIMNALSHFRIVEIQLNSIKSLLQEKEEELSVIREKWYQTLSELADAKDSSSLSDQDGYRGPLFEKLTAQVAKLELMRWMLGRLACVKSSYDWVADPKKRLATLSLTRINNTIELFTQ